ncbi:hypothetical protein P3S67_027896 [Capsicum chacoense]
MQKYWLLINFLALLLLVPLFPSLQYSGKVHDDTKHTLDYVVQQAGSTVDGLRNVSNSLSFVKDAGVSQIFLPQYVQNNIDKVYATISSAAETLESETKKNKKDIMIILDIVLDL